MGSRFTFTEEQKKAISMAVKDLEGATSGELVPYFAPQSDDYDEAKWFSAGVFVLFGIVVTGVLSYFWLLPDFFSPVNLSITLLLLFLAGYAAATFFPRFRVLLLNDDRVAARVRTRAMDVFLTEEVFNTRNRIGILFYVSELEHQVVVLGDQGINQKLDSDKWNEIVSIIIRGIKEGKVADGIIGGIAEAKGLLLEHGFVTEEGGDNELSDEIRIEE